MADSAVVHKQAVSESNQRVVWQNLPASCSCSVCHYRLLRSTLVSPKNYRLIKTLPARLIFVNFLSRFRAIRHRGGTRVQVVNRLWWYTSTGPLSSCVNPLSEELTMMRWSAFWAQTFSETIIIFTSSHTRQNRCNNPLFGDNNT